MYQSNILQYGRCALQRIVGKRLNMGKNFNAKVVLRPNKELTIFDQRIAHQEIKKPPTPKSQIALWNTLLCKPPSICLTISCHSTHKWRRSHMSYSKIGFCHWNRRHYFKPHFPCKWSCKLGIEACLLQRQWSQRDRLRQRLTFYNPHKHYHPPARSGHPKQIFTAASVQSPIKLTNKYHCVF